MASSCGSPCTFRCLAVLLLANLYHPLCIPMPECQLTSSELCFTNAAIFASEPMRFLSLDQITFRLPVPIGAVLRLSSKVVKTTQPSADGAEPAKAHVLVRAEVEEVATGVSFPPNRYNSTRSGDVATLLSRLVILPKDHKDSGSLQADWARCEERQIHSALQWPKKTPTRSARRSCRRRTTRPCRI